MNKECGMLKDKRDIDLILLYSILLPSSSYVYAKHFAFKYRKNQKLHLIVRFRKDIKMVNVSIINQLEDLK